MFGLVLPIRDRVSDVLQIPNPWSIVRRSLPSVIEGRVVPVLLFIGFLKLVGTTGALLVALAWSVAITVFRRARGQRVPALVLLSVVGLTARTVLALATGSLMVYFLQPTIGTALVGVAFLVSVRLGSPLAERLVHDFVPFDADTASHPQLRRFFVRLSLLWAGASLANAALTLWLLLTQTPTTFVLVKSLLGPGFTAAVVAVALVWLRWSLRRNGVTLRFARRGAPEAIPA